MIKKQIRVSDINKDDYPFILFDILLTTNINDIGVKEPYVYPEWMPDEEYLEGVIVTYDNKIYKCKTLTSNTSVFSLDNWEEIDEIEPYFYPEWVPDEEYLEGVIVTYDNKIYKCKTLTSNTSVFSLDNWEEIENTVTYSGESRIDEFKRYGKTINDSDLYNTENPINDGGITKRIIETKPKIDPFSKQYIYKYTFTDSNDNVTTYDDVGDGSSIITYETKGLNENNAINLPSFKNEELLSVIGKPKVEVDVFIDRGINNSFDKHIKIGEIKTLESLEKYGNGVFKIKE